MGNHGKRQADTHTHTIFQSIDWSHAKRYKVLQEVRKELILAGEIRDCAIREVTYKLALK